MSALAGMGRVPSKKDARDLNFLLEKKPEAAQYEHRYWTSQPALDQLDTPQCVGFSGFRWLTSFPIKNLPPFTPADLYKQAQRSDEWPGENYEGSSVRGLFKYLLSAGYVSEYRWAANVDAIVDHLLTVGPVVMGTSWTEGMFMVDREGFIDDPVGEVVGGHAYLLIGANRTKASTIHNTTGAVRILNSWGQNWGDHGRAWLSFGALAKLLADDGEACTANELKVK